MQRRNLRIHPRQIARCHNSRRWAAKETNTHPELALWDENPLLLRQRQLLADGVPIELGTRAFDLLIALLKADGLLISKEELLRRVWPGIVVSEENLKVQVSALRKALGADRDVIRTEFGRGYRFTGVLRWNAGPDAWQCPSRAKLQGGRALFPQNDWRSLRCSFGSS